MNELYHYGIKGMRWGIRNKRNKATKPSKKKSIYKKINREADKATFGKRGVKHIEKRMNKGRSHKSAVASEIVRKVASNTVVSAITLDAVTKGKMHKLLAQKAIRAVSRYANQKAKQRANASLARIGTYRIKHIAGDVYEFVM